MGVKFYNPFTYMLCYNIYKYVWFKYLYVTCSVVATAVYKL